MRLLRWPRLHRKPHPVERQQTPTEPIQRPLDTFAAAHVPSDAVRVTSRADEANASPQRLDAKAACDRAWEAGIDARHAEPLRAAFDATFRMMPLGRRPAFVETFIALMPRVPEAQWTATAVALGEARRTLASDVRWSDYGQALARLPSATTVAHWPAVVAGLAVFSPAHRDRVLYAVEQLRGALWDVDTVVGALPESLPLEVRGHWTTFIDHLRDCGPLPGDQTVAVHALERLDHDTWAAFAGLLRVVGSGLQQNQSRASLLRAVSVACATRDANARPPLVRAALELTTQGMGAAPRADILRALTPLALQECQTLPVLCAPLLARDMPPRDLAMNVVLLLETPAEARASHRDRLLAAIQARGAPHARVDLENVSVYARIAQAARSVQVLQHYVGNVDRHAALRAVGQQLDFWQTHRERCPAALQRTRAGGTELSNARRTLFGRRGPRDYSEALQDNQGYHVGERVVGLGDLCAQVWVGADRHLAGIATPTERERERTNLYTSFFLALAQCIEDDGHRVCSVGVSQRLLQVLQGYVDDIQLDVPRPQALVCALTEALAQEADEPNPVRLQRFLREARERADELYGERGNDWVTFDRHLREYLRLTYTFEG